AVTPATNVATPTGGTAGRYQLALAGWPQPATPCRLLPLLAVAPCRGPGRNRPPLTSSQAMAVAAAGGLAVTNHLCMQTACMWPLLPCRQRLLSLPIAAIST
ncbi:hypothetical protein B296_00044188, partial [Ensete ventricosum]